MEKFLSAVGAFLILYVWIYLGSLYRFLTFLNLISLAVLLVFCLVSQNLPRVWSSAKKLCLEFENIVSENPPHLQLTE